MLGGDTSGGLLARFYPDVVRHTPDMVLIMGGTNDLWWDLDINLIQANIFAMTCQAEYHNIVPVVGLPLPLHMQNVRQQKMMAICERGGIHSRFGGSHTRQALILNSS